MCRAELFVCRTLSCSLCRAELFVCRTELLVLSCSCVELEKKTLVVRLSDARVAGRGSFDQTFVSFPFFFVCNLTCLAVTGRVVLNNNTL